MTDTLTADPTDAAPDLVTTATPPADAAGPDPADFRELMSSFPTGVTVVTTTAADGAPVGLTCSSLVSVCMEPPTLMVCLREQAATLSAALVQERFAVNLLHEHAAEAAQAFAGGVADRFATVAWRESWSGLPWLWQDAFAYAECRVSAHLRLGDHEMVFGEVTGVVVGQGEPLLYGQRAFRSWGTAQEVA